MTLPFRYFEVEQELKKDETSRTDLFFVQSELYTKHLNLLDESIKECCQLTITDLTDYWQITVTRDLLIASFPDGSALRDDARDMVLTEALNGAKYKSTAHYEGTTPYFWLASKESNQIKMTMKTYIGDFHMTAGSFLVDPVPKSRYNEIKRDWHRNSSKASQIAVEAEVAHAQEIDEAKEHTDQLIKDVQRMNREAFEYKLSMFSNFAKVLDAKKTKIRELQYNIEDLQTRKRSFDDMKIEDDPEHITKTLTQSFNKSQKKSSQSLASTHRATTSTQRTTTLTQRTSTSTQRASTFASQDNTQNSRSSNIVKLDSSFSIAKENSQPNIEIDLTQSDDEDPQSSLPPILENSKSSGFLTDDYETDEDLYEPEPTL